MVEDPLSEHLLGGKFPEGASIEVDSDGEKLTFTKSKPEPEPANSTA